jgi:hypothetical protein
LNTLWKVFIGGPVTKKASNLWHNFSEIDVVTESDDGIVWDANIEKRHPAAWSKYSCALKKKLLKIYEVA